MKHFPSRIWQKQPYLVTFAKKNFGPGKSFMIRLGKSFLFFGRISTPEWREVQLVHICVILVTSSASNFDIEFLNPLCEVTILVRFTRNYLDQPSAAKHCPPARRHNKNCQQIVYICSHYNIREMMAIFCMKMYKLESMKTD